MKSSPHALVEDADHGEANHGDDAEPHHGVIAAVGDLSIEELVEGTEVDLLNAEHKDGSQKDESSVVHLLVDDIGDHGPLFKGANVFATAVIAAEEKDQQ